MAKKKAAGKPNGDSARSYKHPEAEVLLRPDVGTQAQFKKRKPPVKYRYDSSLSPALEWDGQNSAREAGEALIAEIAAQAALIQTSSDDNAKEKAARSIQAAAAKLKSLSKPFLNWAGKAERLSFDVPTLPLFVHERLSTKAIIETLSGHRRIRDTQSTLFDLYGDPEHSISDQVLKAYEYQDKWTNRLILGDSLVVMNSLLHYENLGGQVQMIYMDPPYGVKFGSNFQPFVRNRNVGHGDDDDMTREPEMVQAYRDTWELGLHSYLAYLRDRLLICRELLTPKGSIFLQISDENVHHVREVMDEVFGVENFVSLIAVRKTTSEGASSLGSTTDFLLMYCRNVATMKYCEVYVERGDEAESRYDQVLLANGEVRVLSKEERSGKAKLPSGSKVFQLDNITSSRPAGTGDLKEFVFEGRRYTPGVGTFKTDLAGMERLVNAGRLQATSKGKLRYRRFQNDFGFAPITNLWADISGAVQSRSDPKIYAVQTSTTVVQRCLLMTTDPGDLVLDPTCGSGTTAYVAEQWGRRWITTDVSRVPLALARQRLLTATFPWYELKDESRGPAGGFVYERKRNKKGEEVGGIVPHTTLGSIANDEPPKEEVLVDRALVDSQITRVAGPFWVEATIPTPMDWESDGNAPPSGSSESYGSFTDRMLEVLRKSPLLRLEGNRSVAFKNIRPPAKSLSLSAEAVVANGDDKSVAFVFGPENAAVSQKQVFESAREAYAKSYTHLYVVGFAIQPNARELVDNCADVVGIPATYVQATPDLLMGDLLKNMRSSQIFSVCGLPEVKVHKVKEGKFQVELLGLDVFDPVTMELDNRPGKDVPCWLLDTDYNDLSFHVGQAFFPRTGAWKNLKKALKADFDETVWDHLSGTTSAPFEPGEHRKVAVKVIDDRGNELLVVKELNGGRK